MKKATEETLVIIKNETLKRGLVGKILEKFEDADLEITDIRLFRPTKKLAEKHYKIDKNWKYRVGQRALSAFKNSNEAGKIFGTSNPKNIGSKIYDWSVNQLAKKPVIVLALKGSNAVEKIKEMAGYQEPAKANLSTIRGIFSSDSYLKSNIEKRALYNVIHRSSNTIEAKREIKVWFSKSLK
jgi:nucleoside-diphosphate kinase